MKKIVVILGLLFTAISAHAGARWGLAVGVGTTWAWGSMGTARASSDSNQYIGCATYASSTLHYATCYARDAAGTYGTCRTYEDRLIRVAETAGSDSVLEFFWTGSTCTSIRVTNDSRYSPRQP
jgi:hypothetical protein